MNKVNKYISDRHKNTSCINYFKLKILSHETVLVWVIQYIFSTGILCSQSDESWVPIFDKEKKKYTIVVLVIICFF